MTKCSGTGGSQATSPASPQSIAFLCLIILVILNEISVKIKGKTGEIRFQLTPKITMEWLSFL